MRCLFDRYDVSPSRQDHMRSVSNMMEKYAGMFGCSPETARITGLYHDLARDLSYEKMEELALERGHVPDIYELRNPILLHTYASSALILRERLSDDPVVLDAVDCHATGKKGMSGLARLLFIADLSEPLREFAEAERIRHALDRDRDGALLLAAKTTLLYVIGSGKTLHPGTMELYNELAGGCNGR